MPNPAYDSGPLLEICVDDAAGLAAAIAGGADRIELCSHLALGGLTPPPDLMALAASCGVPVHAMIRPRAGNFVYSEAEIALMLRDIAEVTAHGLDGVVFGCLTDDGRLHEAQNQQLITASAGLQINLHRAFDEMQTSIATGVAQAISLGFHRILTSGRAPQANEGAAVLRQVIACAGDDIIIMPGGGLKAWMIADFLKQVPAREVHASCSRPASKRPALSPLTSEGSYHRTTIMEEVRAMKNALRAWGPP